MIRLAANLTWLFTEVPFEERFEAAARNGFHSVEMLFPYDLPARRVRELLDEHGLELALFNLPPGDWEAGERGLAALPGREREFAAAVETAREYARVCGCPNVHAMAGRLSTDAERAPYEQTYVDNLRKAANAFSKDGVTVLIEPLNPIENPDYFLHTTADAIAIIDRVAVPNVALQLDIYHTQIAEGDLERNIRALTKRFAHVQIAGNPHRHEPDAGEVDYAYVLGVLDETGYEGRVGCEYRPQTTTEAGLVWARPYLELESKSTARAVQG